MTAVEKLLSIARAEIGYLEKASNSNLDSKTENAGFANYTKYARDLDKTDFYNGKKNGYDWCDIFVDWCFYTAFGFDIALQMTYQPKKGTGAGCTYSAQFYKNNGKFFTSNPQPGDQIFFTDDGGKSSYHTGIVEKVENGRVYTIEGNTSSVAGVVENGGTVRDKSYPLGASYIGGYGRPNYSLYVEETVPEVKPVTPTPAPTTITKTGVVNAKDGLKCRTTASYSGDYVGAFNYGAKLDIMKESNGWYYVSGTSGWGQLKNVWVVGEYVTVTETTAPSTTPAPSVNTTTKTGIVNAKGGLKCRSTPSNSGDYVGAFNDGAKLDIMKESNGWYYVSGTSGWGQLKNVWVLGKYVTVSKASNTTPAATTKTGIVNAKTGLKCRSSASSSGDYVGAFNYGAKVTIMKESNGWYYVSGTSGWGQLKNVWVLGKYVTVSKNG